MRSHHRPCRVVPRHIQIAAEGTGQVQVPWEPGSPASGLCQNSRTEPEATGPDAHRVVGPPFLLHHQHSSLIPTPASRLPVAKARAKLLRLLQFCAVAAKPVSADPSLFCFPRSRPLFRRILSPSLSLPFPSSTSLDSIPLKTPKGELASTAILNPRLPPSRVVRTSFTPPPTTSTHVPLSSRRVPCNSRVRQHLVLVSIRSSRPHFHLKDNVSPPSPSRLLNWFAPVRSDEAVASGRREARSAKRSNADCQDQRSRVVKHPSFPHGARNKT